MDNIKPIAIITGASTGIGKHLSYIFANNNYEVIIISRNKNKLIQVESEIKNDGFDCVSIVADISKPESINKIYNQIKDPKRIDVLINNAGLGIFNAIKNTSIEEWNLQIGTNLTGAFLMTKMIVNDMIKQKSGKIVFINSVAGINPYPYSTAYVASKFGLRGFSASLREELREHNVKVISIHPGAIDTPFWENVNGEFPRDEMLKTKDVANSIFNAVNTPDNLVCEEIILRRTAGDF